MIKKLLIIQLAALSLLLQSSCKQDDDDGLLLLGAAFVLSSAETCPQMGGGRMCTLNLAGNVSTIGGTGSAGAVNGTGTAASFQNPVMLATEGTNLYITDSNNHLIRRMVIATGEVTTLAGTGSAGGADGTGTAAAFNLPAGITTDGTNLYVTDVLGHRVRKIVIATGEVTTLAGTGSAGSANGTGTAASFNGPEGITTDGTNLYVADGVNDLIRKIVIATGEVTTLAGTGSPGNTDGTGTAAAFDGPYGITTDGTYLYVAEVQNHQVRRIVIASAQVTTIAGTGSAGAVNGTGTAASFQSPRGIGMDGTNLYIADGNNHLIRKSVIAGGETTTLAGSGSSGSADGNGTSASFLLPFGVISDGTSLFVGDRNNHLIRKID